MRDARALAEVVKDHLRDWIDRGDLNGEVQVSLLTEQLDIQYRKVWVEFKVTVILNLAERPGKKREQAEG